ncbi:MAG: SUF system Fe-S cluster assembly regulator [Betaproteobacteria bacterium]|nr:MAG: SUF system Fe-S cluster assembly regulator [Betaproteobacteria bacterium]
MLRMSKLADYGTVVMTSLARAPDHIHSAANVADQTGLAQPAVSKILKTLARVGLLVSARGAKGGYMLARPPREISLAQVIGALEGPIGMTECGSAPGLCLQESGCSIRTHWQRINRMILQALERITLEDMTRPNGRAVEVSMTEAPTSRARVPEAGVNRPSPGAQR